jgi:hypothetical protein
MSILQKGKIHPQALQKAFCRGVLRLYNLWWSKFGKGGFNSMQRKAMLKPIVSFAIQ